MKNKKKDIDPFRYMEFKESEFFSELTLNNNFTKEKAETLYKTTIDCLEQIKDIRADKLLTRKLISELLESRKGRFYIEGVLLEKWLRDSVKHDDTYTHAYNFLTQRFNNQDDNKNNPIELKTWTEIQLFELIKEEDSENTDFKQNQTPLQQIEKRNSELTKKLISFDRIGTIDLLIGELKGYFPDKEVELRKALNGENLNEALFFPHNGNKFVEVFRRLKYNNKLLNNYVCLQTKVN